MKNYISVREAADKWGVSERRVNQYCLQDRIPGVSKFGRSWAIPKDAVKPSDPRAKEQPKKVK
ncbi:MAG: helix-turn-helix domain-containing protein [Candidatus Humimicrobiaceae bacterium]